MDVKLMNLLCRSTHGFNYNRLEMVWYVQGGEHSGLKNEGYCTVIGKKGMDWCLCKTKHRLF